MSADLEAAISAAWEDRASVTPASKDVREPVEAALELLDSGKARVAEPDGNGGWTVNQWLKQAVLLSFRLNDNAVVEAGAAGAPGLRQGAEQVRRLGREPLPRRRASAWCPARSRGAAATSPRASC